MSKLTMTIHKPDDETISFLVEKIKNGYLGELHNALRKAQRAVVTGQTAKIKTKPLTIEIGHA